MHTIHRPRASALVLIGLVGAITAAQADAATVTIQRTKGPLSGNQNVGQYVEFRADVTGGTVLTYQWTISGSIIKDYYERTDKPWSTTAMAPADFQNQTVGFYWLPDGSQIYPNPGTAVSRTVSVSVTTTGGPASTSINVSVERNDTDWTKQPVDYYTTNHCPDPDCTPGVSVGRALSEHENWHATNPPNGFAYDGELFFQFHKLYLSRYQSWRTTFGYKPDAGIWDPGKTPGAQNPPAGDDGLGYPDDEEIRVTGTGTDNRNTWGPSQRAAFAIPSWFTLAGGSSARLTNTFPCDGVTGQKALCDFNDVKELGCAVTSSWHNNTHGAIGYIMNGFKSPRDGIFFRWHRFVDNIYNTYATPGSGGCAPDFTWVIWTIPVKLWWEWPQGLFPDRFRVAFSSPMAPVLPGALLFNGVPAQEVQMFVDPMDGTTSYEFSGYQVPMEGLFTVQLPAGAVMSTAGIPNADYSWTFRIVPAVGDDDGDGLPNIVELQTYLTDAENPDTDGDGLTDGQEVSAGSDPLDNPSLTFVSHFPTPGVKEPQLSVVNPVWDRAQMSYTLPRAAHVTLEAFNASGRRVLALLDRDQPAGHFEWEWTGYDVRGVRLPAGVYHLRMVADGTVLTSPVVVLHR